MRLLGLRGEIEALRLLKQQNLAAMVQRHEDAKAALQTALVAVTEGNRVTAMALEKRFDQINEFRRTLAEQSTTFMPRVEVQVAQTLVLREMETLKIGVSRMAALTETNEKQGAVAQAQLEQRLHSMNEFRSQLKDQSLTIFTRAEFDANFRPLDAKVDLLGRPNWVVFTAFASILFVLAGAAWAVIGLQIAVANAPLINASEVSKADRAQLNSHVDAIDKAIATGMQERTNQIAALRLEIERSRKNE